MSTDSQSLDLPVAIDRARLVCAEAAVGLGWQCERVAGSVLAVTEDATRLHCHRQPLSAEIRLEAGAAGQTRARIDGKVPGFGPISSQHVREQTALLARRIGLAALSEAGDSRRLG